MEKSSTEQKNQTSHRRSRWFRKEVINRTRISNVGRNGGLDWKMKNWGQTHFYSPSSKTNNCRQLMSCPSSLWDRLSVYTCRQTRRRRLCRRRRSCLADGVHSTGSRSHCTQNGSTDAATATDVDDYCSLPHISLSVSLKSILSVWVSDTCRQ